MLYLRTGDYSRKIWGQTFSTGLLTKVVKRFGFEDSRKVSTPLDLNITLCERSDDDRLLNVKEYKSIVGSFIYLVKGSRPDLAFTVTLSGQTHHVQIRQICKLLKESFDT